MDGPLLLPLVFLLAGRDKANQNQATQNEVLRQALTAAIPLPVSGRVVLATINAQDQAKSQARKEKSMVADAVRAGNLGKADLVRFPALEAAFNRLPVAEQSSIAFTAVGTSTTGTPTSEPTTTRSTTARKRR